MQRAIIRCCKPVSEHLGRHLERACCMNWRTSGFRIALNAIYPNREPNQSASLDAFYLRNGGVERHCCSWGIQPGHPFLFLFLLQGGNLYPPSHFMLPDAQQVITIKETTPHVKITSEIHLLPNDYYQISE